MKKVHFTKTRSSPCFRATSSQPTEVVDIEQEPMATSPVVVGSSPVSDEAAAADCEAAYEILPDTSHTVTAESV